MAHPTQFERVTFAFGGQTASIKLKRACRGLGMSPYSGECQSLREADVYFGRGETILAERERIKRTTIANTCLHQLQAA